MNSWDAGYWLGRWSGAALVLLAGVLAAPSTTRAGCGDYPLLHVPATNQGITGVQTARPMQHAPLSPAHHQRPCNGPECSRGKLPMPLPAPLPPVTGEQWGHVSSLTHLDDFFPDGQVSESGRPQPFRLASTIYHPPRLSSHIWFAWRLLRVSFEVRGWCCPRRREYLAGTEIVPAWLHTGAPRPADSAAWSAGMVPWWSASAT